jgi:dTDP-4-amino-4,6-dideoxygalactose transaminase
MIHKRIRQVLISAQRAFKTSYFGFIQGHAHFRPEDLRQIKRLVGMQADNVVADFESRFAKLVGEGEAIAYAAARMGFYDLMRLLGIGKGDEVILLGATCAVMVNAVMRTGATPVFSDIDPETFGSTSYTIKTTITQKTRIIVAQHSFGIPCDIEPIAKLAKEKNIFLLEDCALTLGSKVNGVSVGNFGDAALFSTDHSKPINTLTGGLIYTRDIDLAHRLRISQAKCPELSIARQNALWGRVLLEANYCVPLRYGRMALLDLFMRIRKKLTNAEGDFLSEDFGLSHVTNYPYPAKLPAFLAAIGLIEINRWAMVAVERSILLKELVSVLSDSQADFCLPKAYTDRALQIIPLRLAWSEPKGANVRKAIQHFVHVPWTWFMQPIIATNEPLENLGYYPGSCPVSERIGPNMINIPCNIAKKDAAILIKLLKGIGVNKE